jgi:glycosyltransferase involved in cell wall biosynthesis
VRGARLTGAIIEDKQHYLRCSPDTIHDGWIKQCEPGRAQAAVERFEQSGQDERDITVVIPVGNEPLSWIRESLRSINQQTIAPCITQLVYQPGLSPQRRRRIRQLCRFRTTALTVNASTWADIANHATELIVLVWPGDRLSLRALAAYRDTAAQHPTADLLYGDEDSFDPATGKRSHPRLKPGWAPITLLSRNILGRTICMRRDVLNSISPIGIPATDPDGPDRLALSLARCGVEGVRIPQFLLHRRDPYDSETEPTASDAVRDHLETIGKHDPTLLNTGHGTRRISWQCKEWPAVSIIVPQSSATGVAVQRNLERLIANTDYPNLDITYVSFLPPGSPAQLKTEVFDGAVSVAEAADVRHRTASLSAAAMNAASDLILFLDPGIYPLDRCWLHELVQWLDYPGVGVVAPAILDTEEMIRHVGYAAGLGLLYGHICDGLPVDTATDFLQPNQTRNVSAVSLRAMLMRKTTFERAGRFDTVFREQYADIAFCERVRAAGEQVVCHPGARLYQSAYAEEPAHEDIQRLCHQLTGRTDGVDPFLHPRLNVDDPALATQSVTAMPAGARLAQKAAAIQAACHASEPIDIFSGEAVGAFATAHDLSWSPPSASAADAAQDSEGAARFLLQRLHGNAALRQRFPHALGQGRDGDFCRWCCTDGAAEWQLSSEALDNVRAAFDGTISYKVRQLFNWRWDIRFYFPLAALPWGRSTFIRWAKTDGRATGLTDTQLWWFLIESAENPAREIATLYGLFPEWQRKHPPSLTQGNWPELLEWISRVYAVPHEEVRSVAPPVDPDYPPALAGPVDPDAGVNILGHLCLHSGNKQSVEVCMDGLHRNGIAASVRDAPAVPTGDPPDRRKWLGTEVYDVSINFLSLAFSMEGWYAKGTLHSRPGAYHIGNWFWEFREVPAEWAEHAEHYDEAWAATRFIESIMNDALPIPVTYMPAGHLAEPPPDLTRDHFGLPEDRYLFLFVFDMGSCTERKNPHALIEAFQRAVHPDDKATLVLKFAQGDRFCDTSAALRRSAAEAGNVHVIDATFSREDTLGLINCCDCYVSLHRSEGLGLTIAEAMMMGKVAIATGYSGNLEFMTPQNSLLVDYEMIEIEQDWPPYRKGWKWADPSVAHAAEQMRFVLDHPEETAAIAARGCADARKRFDMQAYAARLDARLKAIRSARRGSAHTVK